MDKVRTGAFMLFVLLVPVSCIEALLSHPVTCYFIDGLLFMYCILATAFFFREKFSKKTSAAVGIYDDKGGIYQELDRSMDADPYQVIEPSNRKKKPSKKKKSESTQLEEDKDPYESLVPRARSPSPQ